jgi:serine/threonine protein kinase
VDIWSTGVILYTLLVGKPPFQSKDVLSTYKLILMNSYDFPTEMTISSDAKNLIHKILQVLLLYIMQCIQQGLNQFITCFYVQSRPDLRLNLNQISEHPFLRTAPSQRPTLANTDQAVVECAKKRVKHDFKSPSSQCSLASIIKFNACSAV